MDFSQCNPEPVSHLEQCLHVVQLDDPRNYTVVQTHSSSLCTHTQSPFWIFMSSQNLMKEAMNVCFWLKQKIYVYFLIVNKVIKQIKCTLGNWKWMALCDISKTAIWENNNFTLTADDLQYVVVACCLPLSLWSWTLQIVLLPYEFWESLKSAVPGPSLNLAFRELVSMVSGETLCFSEISFQCN